MTSIVSSATAAAHSAAASLLSKAQIAVGGDIPVVAVKEDAPDKPFDLNLTGKNIIVGVPGAFTGTCSAQVPGYIKAYEQFQAKGVNNIYIIGVNDVFVMKAWKENLASTGTPVHFIADDKGALTTQLGMLFDASPLLGSPRSKRYAIVADGHKATSVAVEEVPSQLTVTAADKVLALL